MDAKDREIINRLRQNARVTSSEISKHVHLSVPAVTERIRKLEEEGVIRQYTARLNREALGLSLTAFILVSISRTEHTEAFKRAVQNCDAVLECHHIVGEYDYLLKVAVASPKELEALIYNTLHKPEWVAKTNTIIALSTVKEE